jgi:hypothetical protein
MSPIAQGPFWREIGALLSNCVNFGVFVALLHMVIFQSSVSRGMRMQSGRHLQTGIGFFIQQSRLALAGSWATRSLIKNVNKSRFQNKRSFKDVWNEKMQQCGSAALISFSRLSP